MSLGTALDFVLVDETCTGDDDPVHIVCCRNEDVALCGADLRGLPWVDDEDAEVCEHCERLDNVDVIEVCSDDGLCVDCPVALFRGLP